MIKNIGMGDTNAKGKFEKEDSQQEEKFITINTIEQTVFVERLPKPEAISRNRGDILKYGRDNLYPDKIKSMAQRSQSTMSAIKTLTRFSAGQGFEDDNANELIINEDNQTLRDILDHAANEKASIGVAIHCNYNVLGQIIELQEVPFETLRWSHDMQFLVFCPDWSRDQRYGNNKKIAFRPFNPDNVQAEIAEAGRIEKYTGQIIYWIPKKKEIYPLATFDPALDDTQFEHESGVNKLRNIQNGYSANYIIIVPSQVEADLEKKGVIAELFNSKGAKNSGKTKMVPINSSAFDAIGSRKLVEEIPRTGIDKLFEKQNKETKDNIFAIFNQPMILNGITKDGMFNQESFTDAFDYYNSITQRDRDELERLFNHFMSFSIWNVGDLEIMPLEYISRRDVKPAEVVEEPVVIEPKTEEDE